MITIGITCREAIKQRHGLFRARFITREVISWENYLNI